MGYKTGCHTTFNHRNHLVRPPKSRYTVLIGDVRSRVRERRAKGRSSRKMRQEVEQIPTR